MKTRLQLANGYVAGILTPEEKEVAEEFPLVMGEVKRLMKLKSKPVKKEMKKNARFKTT